MQAQDSGFAASEGASILPLLKRYVDISIFYSFQVKILIIVITLR
jgi:hypothetical protein